MVVAGVLPDAAMSAITMIQTTKASPPSATNKITSCLAAGVSRSCHSGGPAGPSPKSPLPWLRTPAKAAGRYPLPSLQRAGHAAGG